MATKKKLPTQPKELHEIKPKNEVIEDVSKIEEAVHAYPVSTEIITTNIEYKILVIKNDYFKLQEEVSKHLNEGWELVGGISTSMTVSPYESVTVFAQSVVKH
jgi:hypothetical protein